MECIINKIVVLGLGYIGLPTSAILATCREVIGVDIHQHIIETVNAGQVHIVEPELEQLVKQVVQNKKLKASLQPETADAFIITVPTPFKENFAPDISYIEKAAQAIAPYLVKGNLVILESTSPVGTTREVSKILANLRPDLTFPHEHVDADIYIAYCPERVMPGKIMREIVHNTRIIGGISVKCAEKARELYQLFVKGDCIITSNSETAEMTKLTENAFRDVNIAFANELSLICDKLNINTSELIRLANFHPRVNILKPGAGVGGHCIAVDPWFIVHSQPDTAKLIRTAREVNDSIPHTIVEKIKQRAEKQHNPTIACYGLAYKANTDDLRESPALKIVEALLQATQYKILVVEPNINKLPIKLSQYLRLKLVSLEEALTTGTVHAFLVEHDEFKSLDNITIDENVINPVNIEFKQDALNLQKIAAFSGNLHDR